ncbi:unnamed protein product [marine sediment metagenome]|uniref:Uncharacterized protein n=1 Tax=marine sediment metagenome TaxID=412755 RepID=X1ML51_9ZZZZ
MRYCDMGRNPLNTGKNLALCFGPKGTTCAVNGRRIRDDIRDRAGIDSPNRNYCAIERIYIA